jgi:hypothetical protein
MSIELQHISHSFQTDSDHLLNIAKVAFKYGSVKLRTGYQAKIVVDLYMSIECALKSLLCTRKPSQNAEEALRSIFRYRHDLKRLIKVVDPTSLSQSDCDFLKELNKKGVSLRYELDLFSLVSCELLSDDYEAFQIDTLYVEKLMGIADHVCSEAQTDYRSTFTSKPRLLTRKQMEREVHSLRDLLKRARNKK